MHTLDPNELAQWLDTGHTSLIATEEVPCLLDVREAWEIEQAHIPGSLSLTLSTLANNLDTLHIHANKDTPIVCICHHGVRSAHAAHFLKSQGFAHVFNLRGGIHAWAQEVDPSMRTY